MKYRESLDILSGHHDVGDNNGRSENAMTPLQENILCTPTKSYSDSIPNQLTTCLCSYSTNWLPSCDQVPCYDPGPLHLTQILQTPSPSLSAKWRPTQPHDPFLCSCGHQSPLCPWPSVTRSWFLPSLSFSVVDHLWPVLGSC